MASKGESIAQVELKPIISTMQTLCATYLSCPCNDYCMPTGLVSYPDAFLEWIVIVRFSGVRYVQFVTAACFHLIEVTISRAIAHKKQVVLKEVF